MCMQLRIQHIPVKLSRSQLGDASPDVLQKGLLSCVCSSRWQYDTTLRLRPLTGIIIMHATHRCGWDVGSRLVWSTRGVHTPGMRACVSSPLSTPELLQQHSRCRYWGRRRWSLIHSTCSLWKPSLAPVLSPSRSLLRTPVLRTREGPPRRQCLVTPPLHTSTTVIPCRGVEQY